VFTSNNKKSPFFNKRSFLRRRTSTPMHRGIPGKPATHNGVNIKSSLLLCSGPRRQPACKQPRVRTERAAAQMCPRRSALIWFVPIRLPKTGMESKHRILAGGLETCLFFFLLGTFQSLWKPHEEGKRRADRDEIHYRQRRSRNEYFHCVFSAHIQTQNC